MSDGLDSEESKVEKTKERLAQLCFIHQLPLVSIPLNLIHVPKIQVKNILAKHKPKPQNNFKETSTAVGVMAYKTILIIY